MTRTAIANRIEALITNPKFKTLPQPRLIVRARHLYIVDATELKPYDKIICRLSSDDLTSGLLQTQWNQIIKQIQQFLSREPLCPNNQTP